MNPARLVQFLRRRARAARADEGGFVLMAVLVATMVFGVLVVAMLGLVAADISTRSNVAETARIRRAADAALETWINQLRTSPQGSLGQPATDCGPSTPIAIDDGSGEQVVEVTVDCAGEATAATPLYTGLAGSTAIALTGGFTAPLDDLSRTTSSGVGVVITKLAGWLGSLLSPIFPGFIHIGPQPLTIDGDLATAQWAFGWHTDGTASPVSVEGAPVVINGAFRQGDYGMPIYANPFILWTTPDAPPCGELDPRWRSVMGSGEPGHDFAASLGMSCNLGRPALDVPTWTNPITTWSPSLGAAKTLPTCPVAPSKVVIVPPGAYNRNDVAHLNTLFGHGPGSCGDVTFWFPPGNYYFDSGGLVDVGDISTRSALMFNNAASRFVFGTPKGWTTPDPADPATMTGTTADNFPEACVPQGGAPGVTLTLSSRTTIKVRSGLVSGCSNWVDGHEQPLVFQEKGADAETWAGVPQPSTVAVPTASSASSPPYVNPANATTSITAGVPGDYPDVSRHGSPYDTSEGAARRTADAHCGLVVTCTVSLNLSKGFMNLAKPATGGDLTRARLRIRGDSPGAGDIGSSTTVTVTYGDGSGSCTVPVPGVPRGYGVFDIDLLGSATNCTTQGLTDATQLENATVTLNFTLSNDNLFCAWNPGVWCSDMYSRVDYAWIESASNNRPPSAMESIVNPTDPARRSMLSLYGPVYMPRTQVFVSWEGTAANVAPIFGGGLVASALLSASGPGTVPGKLAGLARVASERRVSLKAIVAGRLRMTESIRIIDSNGAQPSIGRQVEVRDYRTCNVEQSVVPLACPSQ